MLKLDKVEKFPLLREYLYSRRTCLTKAYLAKSASVNENVQWTKFTCMVFVSFWITRMMNEGRNGNVDCVMAIEPIINKGKMRSCSNRTGFHSRHAGTTETCVGTRQMIASEKLSFPRTSTLGFPLAVDGIPCQPKQKVLAVKRVVLVLLIHQWHIVEL